MAGLLEKSLLLGLGVLTLTRDKVVQIVDRMVAEGDVESKDAPAVVDKLVARGEQEREALRGLLRQELEKLNVDAAVPIATRKDIEDVNAKLDVLTAQVEKLAGKKSAKAKA